MPKSNYVIFKNYNENQIVVKENLYEKCKSNSDCNRGRGEYCSNGECRRDMNAIRHRLK